MPRLLHLLRRLFSRTPDAPDRAAVIFATHSPTEIDRRQKRVIGLQLKLSATDPALADLRRDLMDELNALGDARMHGFRPVRLRPKEVSRQG